MDGRTVSEVAAGLDRCDLRCVAAQSSRKLGARPVVHDHDLSRSPRLGEQAVHGRADLPGLLVIAHDYRGDGRHRGRTELDLINAREGWVWCPRGNPTIRGGRGLERARLEELASQTMARSGPRRPPAPPTVAA